MTQYRMRMRLKSDTTFGRGDGVAGFIDREVEHDRYGMPFLRGRTLKGLLSEEADNIIFALAEMQQPTDAWRKAHDALFGKPGSGLKVQSAIHFGRCQLPDAVRSAVRSSGAGATDVLESLTAVRRQTAMDETGVPIDGSLRAMRIVLRETPFEAILDCGRDLTEAEQTLLAASVKALRRVGTGRNRGRGRVYQLDLVDENDTSLLDDWLTPLKTGGIVNDDTN